MKDKTIAAILAFFGGIIGLQRFYLGQKGTGMAHLFFFILAVSAGPSPFTFMLLSLAAIFGIIDAITYLSMDGREFDLKYNEPVAQTSTVGETARHSGHQFSTMTDRERRFQERQRERAAREQEQIRRTKERYHQRTDVPAPQYASRQDPGRGDRERGVHYFRDYDYASAIENFQKALAKNAQDVASHFNIACAYSVEEEADRAFYHLDRAVALGFDDFERIRTHDSLAYLRVQRGYPQFARNNFRLATAVPEPVPNYDDPVSGNEERAAAAEPPPIGDELLDQLQRLAALREKGLLTETEFATQKRRLLG